MSFLRSLVTDLVEKRLWPIAIALVIAIVAIPVLLAGGPEAAVTALGATGATGSRSDITLEASAPVRGNREGVLRNPFKPRAKVPVVAAPPAATPAAAVTQRPVPFLGSSSGSSGSGSGSSGGGGSSAASPGVPTVTPPVVTPATSVPAVKAATPAASATDAYAAIVHFGPADGAKEEKVLGRLTPLKVGTTPIMIFDGVLGDRRTAVFELSSAVSVTGDAVCHPPKGPCLTIELKPGEHEQVVVTADDGSTATYTLGLVAVDNGAATAKAAAAEAGQTGTTGPTASTRSASPPAGYGIDRVSGLLHHATSPSLAKVSGSVAAVAQAGFAFGGPTGPTAP